MAKKIYGLKNAANAVLTFPIGKATVRCEFSGGVLDERNGRLATMVTSDPIVQIAIEGSPQFGNSIVLIQEIDSADRAAPTRSPARDKKKGATAKGDGDGAMKGKAYEDVTSVAEIVQLLTAEGVSASRLKDETSIMREAKAKGMTFPNLFQES